MRRRRVDGVGIATSTVDDDCIGGRRKVFPPSVGDLHGSPWVADRPVGLGVVKVIEAKVEPGTGSDFAQRERSLCERGNGGQSRVEGGGANDLVRLYPPGELECDAIPVFLHGGKKIVDQ